MQRGGKNALVLVAAVLLQALAAVNAAGEPGRFRRVAALPGERVSWIGGDGAMLAFGSGRQLRIASTSRIDDILHTRELPAPVTDGVLVGGRLLFVEEHRRLRSLEVDDPAGLVSDLALEPRPRGDLRVAHGPSHLIVAEDGLGLRFLEVESRGPHAGHGTSSSYRFVGMLSLPERFTAIAATGTTVYAALSSRTLAVIDVRDIDHPVVTKRLPVADDVQALAADGDSVFVLGRGGLSVLDADGALTVHPEVRGTSIQSAGRRLYVAGVDPAIAVFEDLSPRAMTYTVNVTNSSFSPATVSIQAGDTVRWTNSTFNAHNVVSCTSNQTGCAGLTAHEAFTSGPATGIFVYTHTFTSPGDSRYVCQPHASFMIGVVSVHASRFPPPRVPDGIVGNPMTVGKFEQDGSALLLNWDATTCPAAADHEILFGMGSQLPPSPGGAFGLSGARCSVGAPPYVWNGVPDPGGDASRFLWWLVVATDGVTTEGSWGEDSSGAERNGPGADGDSGECGITIKDSTNTCE